MPRLLASIALVLFTSANLASAADWPLFRGPDRNGITQETNVPLTWSQDKNIRWKVPLPSRGNSSPVVSGDRVFLTCAEDRRGTVRSLFCFNRNDGKLLWKQSVTYEKAEPSHSTNPYCASSPAADGQRVVVWHGSAGVYCYDYSGKLLWSRDLGEFRHIWGYAASPVFCNDAVIINCGPGARTFIISLNRQTGQTLWQTDEPGGADDKSPQTGNWLGSWSTPIITTIDGRQQVIVAMPFHINAYDPSTGKIFWTCEGNGPLAYTDPMISNGQAAYFSGYGGPAIGFRLGGSGNVTATNRLWRVTDKNPQRIGSGVIVGDSIYMPSEPSLHCVDLATGKERWRHKIDGHSFWSSIILAADRLYVTSQQGTTFVFAPNSEKFTLLQTNELGEESNSTPAVSNGQIFLRTFGHLYCIE